MIIFTDVEIEGFGSIVSPTTFQLDLGNTLSVIRGEVGSGKTSIPSSICWVLFGKTLKEKGSVETWEKIRPNDWRGTKVKINWAKDGNTYSVIRCKSYKGKVSVGGGKKVSGGSNLFFLENGFLVTSNKGKLSIQDAIEKALGYSFDLFKNSIIFGQKMKRIISETGPAKKKLFEEAFEAGFIEEAKNNEDGQRKKLVEKFEEIQTQLDSLNDRISDKKDQYEDAIEYEENFDKDRLKTAKRLNIELAQYKDQLEFWKGELKNSKPGNADDITNKINKIESTIDNYLELKAKIRTKQNKISDLQEKLKNLNTTCISCGQPIKKSEIIKQRKSLESDILSQKKALYKLEKRSITKEASQKLKRRVEILTEERGSINEKTKTHFKAKTQIKHYIDKINEVENEINKERGVKVKIKSIKYKTQIKKLKGQKSKLEKQSDSLQSEIDIKNWLINDPLSNNGLKAYIFNNRLERVNESLNNYARILGFQIEFGIDLQSSRKDFYQYILKNGIVVPYEDLSGGQQQLSDTTVAFAIHDSISELRPMNIMFMDEPFESLGANEIETVSELLSEKAKEKSLFLITHHQSFNPVNVNEIEVYLDENQHTVIR